MNKVLVIGGVAFLGLIFVGAVVFFITTANYAKKATAPAMSPVTLPTLQQQNSQNPQQLPTSDAPVTPANQIKLVVTSPNDGLTVSTASLKVSGQTVPNADVAINEVDLKADNAGNFTTTLKLEEGENTIVVDAFDADGNTSEQTLTVTYQPAN